MEGYRDSSRDRDGWFVYRADAGGGDGYWHHRHIVAEARANIRRELQSNHNSALEDVGYLSQNLTRVTANVRTLHELEKNSKIKGSLTNAMMFSSLDDAAWRTAWDTGALAYMPYDEVQQYSEIYNAQQEVNDKARSVADQEFVSLAPMLVQPDVENVPAADLESMLHGNGVSLIELCTLRQYVQELDEQYVKALDLKGPSPQVSDCKAGQ